MLTRMDDPQEQQIARGLQEGKIEAWHALYDAYSERVWRAVARLIGPNSADVADVVQEVFLAAARSARGYDPTRGTLANWIFGIARNCAALHFRHQGRHRRLRATADEVPDPEGLLAWLEDRRQGPPEALESAELAALVRGVLGRLPQEYASLLVGKYLDGAAAEDLADRQHCSTVALRSKLARAREAFRRVFMRALGRSGAEVRQRNCKS